MKHLKKFNESEYIDDKLPTAEEFTRTTPILHDMWNDTRGQGKWNQEEINKILIEFAKLHVKEALRVAAYSAVIVDCGNPYDSEDDSKCVDEKSILNSYPETNIK